MLVLTDTTLLSDGMIIMVNEIEEPEEGGTDTTAEQVTGE